MIPVCFLHGSQRGFLVPPCAKREDAIIMKAAESSFIHFIRSVILLATLIFVPGIAIFWNHLPKNTVPPAAPPKSGETQIRREEPPEPAISMPVPHVASESPVQQVAWEHLPPLPPPSAPLYDFTLLEQRLQALGATDYQLAKWGSQGELYRFACYVTPSDSHAYKKYFQAVGTDALSVMQSVIADIENWKQLR